MDIENAHRTLRSASKGYATSENQIGFMRGTPFCGPKPGNRRGLTKFASRLDQIRHGFRNENMLTKKMPWD